MRPHQVALIAKAADGKLINLNALVKSFPLSHSNMCSVSFLTLVASLFGRVCFLASAYTLHKTQTDALCNATLLFQLSFSLCR